MKTLLVRYTTTEESAAANAALVRAVFDELRALAPGGLRYASYQLGDGRTFLHLASIESPAANPLLSLPAFKAFQASLRERCVEPPVVTELTEVGAY